MTNAEAKIEALKYAIAICDSRRSYIKSQGVNAAYLEVKIFLEAAIERIEAGEDMTDYAYFQKS